MTDRFTEVASIVGLIAKLIEFVVSQTGETTDQVQERVKRVLAKPATDETDPALKAIENDLPASPR